MRQDARPLFVSSGSMPNIPAEQKNYPNIISICELELQPLGEPSDPNKAFLNNVPLGFRFPRPCVKAPVQHSRLKYKDLNKPMYGIRHFPRVFRVTCRTIEGVSSKCKTPLQSTFVKASGIPRQ